MHWVKNFYPADCRQGELLPFYSKHFDTVEINTSFYGLPERRTVDEWTGLVPDEFLFAVKASRYITHMKKLKDSAEAVHNFLDSLGGLGKQLGPILFQLPPRWKRNEQRLSAFLDILPAGDYAFEFRNRSWFEPEVYELLSRHETAFCIYDLDGKLSPRKVTADFVYVRLHGPDGPYRGRYDVQTLSGWAGRCAGWARQGRNVFCYFDNDESGYAAQNALELTHMIRN
jgi:uncharacterized protein YecE (DUF72 family)